MNQTLYAAALRVIVIAVFFVLIVSGTLTVTYLFDQVHNPLRNLQITSLRMELAKDAANEALKSAIREEDRRLRAAYFQRRAFATEGVWLLLGGVAVLILAVKGARHARRWLPFPPAHDIDDPRVVAAFSRKAVLAFGAVVAVGAAGFIVSLRAPAPPAYLARAEQAVVKAERAKGFASAAELAKNWPCFRGAGNIGSATATPPATWSEQTIRWSVETGLPGKNSPVVWGDRVFLCGADEHKREVYCYDAETGALRWTKAVEGLSCQDAGTEPLNVMADTGYAAPTMATDGRRVFAIFANGDLACFDLDGNPMWAKNMGRPVNMYGHASSLITWRNRLLLLFDQGSSAEDGKSALYALDAVTGDEIWKVKRPVPNSWASPSLITVGGRELLITCANPLVIAYDPKTGTEAWRAECLGGDVAPSPAFAGGRLFVTNTGSNLAALDPATGKTQWTAQDGLPDIVSPVSDGKVVLLFSMDFATCVDAATGKKLWEHQFSAPFHASPMLINGVVYVLDTTGVMHRLQLSPEFKELGTATLGEGAETTPAFVGSRMYIRGEKHLFCIGE
jgi:outer membrane protein assembly factor BamB